MTTTPDPEIPSTTRAEAISTFLHSWRIPHEVIEHEPVQSAAAEAQATQAPSDSVAKTIILHDAGGIVVAVVPASRRLDLHKLRAELGASRRLRLADEREIAGDFPGLEVGAIPPFGPSVPMAEVVDRRLMTPDRILCPAGDHRHSVLVSPADVVRMTEAVVADISQD